MANTALAMKPDTLMQLQRIRAIHDGYNGFLIGYEDRLAKNIVPYSITRQISLLPMLHEANSTRFSGCRMVDTKCELLPLTVNRLSMTTVCKFLA
jgi:hypothetical protein